MRKNQTTLHLFMENCSDEPTINMICCSKQDTLTRHSEMCCKGHRVISKSFQQAFEAYLLQDSHQNTASSSPSSRSVVQMKRESRERERCTPPRTMSLQHSGHAGLPALPTPAQCWRTCRQTQWVWEMWITQKNKCEFLKIRKCNKK